MSDGGTVVREAPPVADAARKPPRRMWPVIFALLAAVGLGCLVYVGIRDRTTAEAELAHRTNDASVPTVNVTRPQAGSTASELVLPGTTQAFSDAPIFARTSGYVKRWYFDIGTHVKQGQLLAEIETPEIDEQLQQARADLATAKANLRQAETTAARWQELLKSDSVSQQETDQAVNGLHASRATVDSNAANVRRLEQLQGFQKVVAPFDGVITARNTDVGQLVDAGASGQSRELFHLAAIDRMRVFVAVPEVHTSAVTPGGAATLTLDSRPGKSYRGTLARTANAIDPVSRTLLVEVDVDNPTGELIPGAYAFVHLKLPASVRAVTVPANALLFRSEGLRVAVVRAGKAVLVPIAIGRDQGSMVEVVSGLTVDDAVILDPSDSLVSGARVRVP